jgi:hypothetical protein
MRRYLVMATVIGLVMGAGIAIAQVSDDGVIHACANDKDGTLRLVDGPDDCGDKKEVPVFWNQQGLQGEPGQDGVDGADGVDGLPGPPGADGNLALANQVCEEDGASVIGFNADGDIICQVGGATTTTTTTTTQPPDYFDLNGEWTVTASQQHDCGDVAPSVGSTISVNHGDEPFEIWWQTSVAGSWHFETYGLPITDDDVIGASGVLYDPSDQPFDAEMGADRIYSADEQIYVVTELYWGDPGCTGTIDFTATR